jgi:hypothetical protein
MAPRIKDFAALAWMALCAAVLALLWLAVWRQFYGVMVPRLGEWSALAPFPVDRPCDNPQCDFSAFWPAGLLARAHRVVDLYDPAKFLAYRQGLLTSGAVNMRWCYPPTSLLPAMAVSYLPFEPGFWVWGLVNFAGAIGLLRWAGLTRTLILAVLLSPAALWNAELGQLGLLMGAALVAGLTRLTEQPGRAGAVSGLLLLKPQYGLLLPVIALAARRWKFVLACGAACLALCGLTTLLCGVSVWHAYVSLGLPDAHLFLQLPPSQDGSQKFGVSVFWMLRSFGFGVSAAYGGQALASGLALLGAWAVWRRGDGRGASAMMITLGLTLLVTPYGYTDDMVAWSVALAALAQARGWRIGLVDVLGWLWPMLCPIIVGATGLLLTPLVVLLVLGREAWRMRQST